MNGNIELYDVGRVITGPFKAGYNFIATLGDKYIQDKDALGRIQAFHKDRSLGIDQDAFNHLNNAWVQAIQEGTLEVNPNELVYSDVGPRFNLVKARGDYVFLLTSGSVPLTKLLLGDECSYDSVLVGEEIGDKNDPNTFGQVWDNLEGNISAFYDDKPKVVSAALQGFRMAGGNPSLYLVDRLSKVPEEQVAEFESQGVIRISSFDEIID